MNFHYCSSHKCSCGATFCYICCLHCPTCNKKPEYKDFSAPVVELADTLDLGSSASGHEGSSPSEGTIIEFEELDPEAKRILQDNLWELYTCENESPNFMPEASKQLTERNFERINRWKR